MKESIIARETEIHQLDNLLEEELAQFVAVYGRRRVGKTFLIREYFNDEFTFFHTAVSPQELKDRQCELLYRVQLDEFAKTLKMYGLEDDSPIKDWFDAFDRLWRLIQSHPSEERLVLFFDEMPWLDTPRAGFMSALEHFWNRYASGRHKLLMIAAGSATTWMLDKLINNNGGLYNRTTRDIHIHPFTLAETETYFQSRGVVMDRYDIVQAYMIVGGIPYYLSLFEKGNSLAQNIDAMFFSRGNKMEKEYGRLFQSMFADNDKYRRIVECIGKHRYGILRSKICEDLKITDGGNISEILLSLEECDLITSFYNFGESKRNKYYKLTDSFCLFYINFAAKHPTNNRTYWQDNQNLPKLSPWCGQAFEDICFSHQEQIKRALGIQGVHTEIYPWRFVSEDDTPGAQIDMLIDRADRVVNVCGMKFVQGLFSIEKDYDEKLRNKIVVITEKTGRRRNPQMTLITTYGLKNGLYSGRIQKVVKMDDLFAF